MALTSLGAGDANHLLESHHQLDLANKYSRILSREPRGLNLSICWLSRRVVPGLSTETETVNG